MITQQKGISSINVTSTFVASPSTSTIITILSMQIISMKIVDSKPQLSTKFSRKGKDKEKDIDLDEIIVILNWDISTLDDNQMHILGEIL